MLSQVTVKNFQSLSNVALELKPFTVIVGPSSSGKSAFTRALKTLTSNARGDSFISHGENQCLISASTEAGTVALMRGKKNEYAIIPEHGDQKSFTKLSGGTPQEVSEFIGIPAKDPLNYSNQFDMPYLLTSSAAEVARELGALTNVSVIYEAAREASRRRLQASSTLKTRAADYADLTKNLDRYRTLKDDQQTLADIQQRQAVAQETQTRIDRLAQAIAAVEAIPEVTEPRAIPDCTQAVEAHQRLARLASLIAQVEYAEIEAESAGEDITQYSLKAWQAQEEYLEALREAGTCPTCGQDTHQLEHADTH